MGDLFSLCVHSYLYCTLAQIKFKGKTQYNIRWGSHYSPLAKNHLSTHTTQALIKIARRRPVGTSRTHLGDWPKEKVVRSCQIGVQGWELRGETSKNSDLA